VSQPLRSVYLVKVDPATNSDKFYRLALSEEGGTFTVAATYGRRGAAKPQQDIKYQGPDEGAAQLAYERTRAEKLKGGYSSVDEAPDGPDAQVQDAEKALGKYILEQIDHAIRGGLQGRPEIIEGAFELGFYDPQECQGMEEGAVRAAVMTVVNARMAAHDADKLTWPTTTDNDRLRVAFYALAKLGIVTLEDRGSTQSDGYEEFLEDLRANPRQDRIKGYCFYHRQDVDRALDGGGLYLAFGPRPDTKNEQADGAAIGVLVVDELRRAGLDPRWDGTFAQRIHLATFDWKRR
jgi:predicted DNA-binding WGR domain protein